MLREFVRHHNHRIRAWKLKIRNENLFSEESQKVTLRLPDRPPRVVDLNANQRIAL